VSNEPITVLYIGGLGRSGSTLLGEMLSQAPGIVSVGELRYLWERGPVDDVLCSCGRPFSACPFWLAVGDHAFGGWDTVAPREALELQRRVDRHRRIPGMLWSAMRGRTTAETGRYIHALERLYASIAVVSGCPVVVDSTKDPPHAFLLWRAAAIDLRVVHLVRDSRAVAYAWTKRVRRPEVVDCDAYMGQESPQVIGWKWNDYNLLFEALRIARVPTVSMRYEDLAEAPRSHVARALSLVADRIDAAPVPADDGVFVRTGGHSLSGNPSRFERGAVEVRPDEDWRLALPRRQFRAVTAITFPLLLRYRYTLTRAAR
jgi:hypothetical protein